MILYCFKCRTRASLEHPCFRIVQTAIAYAVLVVATLGLLGCQAKKPLNNFQPGVEQTTYIRPSQCHDIPKGEFECNHVRFSPKTVKAQ